MTKELYEKLDMASKTLCEYCEDAGSCPEDSQFCDMYTRYDQYGASMLRLARTLNLVSVEYCDAEPLKLIFDLG